MTKPVWMVRAAEGGRLFDDFKEKNVVAIGWGEAGSFIGVSDRQKIIEMVKASEPDYSKQQAIVAGSQVNRFCNDFKIGDRVVTYDPSRRVYSVGTIKSDYRYDPSLIPELPNYREVKWEGEVSRDDLSVTTKNTLGAISTLFLLSTEAASEIEGRLAGQEPVALNNTEEAQAVSVQEDILRDIQARSHEFIKDAVNRLTWDQMQDLVAGLLRAMGYKTQVSLPGADRGKDIVASPDGFGFEQPRIIVEVKHRKGAMGSQEIRSFLGGRHKDDKGLYVSTGGFTKDAQYEADRASIPLTLMDLDGLVKAITEHYEKMDMDTRVLVPLTKVYWPAI